MIVRVNGEQHEADAYSISYGNDLLDGVLLDMEKNYVFLSDHVESHRDYMDDIEYTDHYDLSECEADYDQAPHSWVVNSVGMLVVRAAEQACVEAWE